MESQNQPLKEKIKVLLLLHGSFIAGPLMLLVVFVLINSESFTMDLPDFVDPFFWVVNLLVFLSVPVGNVLFRNFKTTAFEETALDQKIAKYQTGLVLHSAMHEGPTLFCMIAFLFYGNFYYVFLALLILGLMATKFPTPGKIAKELKLSKTEQEQLYQ